MADKENFPWHKDSVGFLGFLTKMWYLLKTSDVLVNLRNKIIWQKKKKKC
jgi:hypothetical protein